MQACWQDVCAIGCRNDGDKAGTRVGQNQKWAAVALRARRSSPHGDSTPAAVWFAYSPDRKGEHPQSHLRNFTGTLQAGGYAGFDRVYQAGRVREAACWAHVRRKFYDLEVAHKSPVAAEALERIAE